jgi:iron complex outermembrane receptor protein
MKWNTLRRTLCAFGLLAGARGAGAAPHAASDTTAREPAIIGHVQDSGGVPLANAQVVITTINRSTTTDAEGNFAFRGLAAGRYHLDVLLLGYARADADVVVPPAGPDVRVTIVMRATVLRLSNVLVTASPTGNDPLAITQSTVDISGKELSRALGSSVAQTLSGEPGMATRFNGPAANTPVIRGLSGERVLVLQDGERAGDLSSTQTDHGLSIDPLVAQRIEVVRGPASLLYGTNALGGVVNVISNDIPNAVPSHLEGYVATQGESVNPGGAFSLGATLPVGHKFAATARAGLRSTGDLYQGGRSRLDNTFSRNANGLASLGYIGEDVHAGVAYRTYGFDYGLPSAPGDDEAGTHIEGLRQEVRGRVEMGVTRRSPVRHVRADATAQLYNHDEVEASGEVGTSFRLRTQTANVTAKTQMGRADGALGLSGLFRQYSAAGEEALTPAARSSTAGLFVYEEFPIGAREPAEARRAPVLQLGARYDLFRISSDDAPQFGAGRTLDFNSASGSLGLSVPLGEGVSIGASVARAFRAPTVEELFSNAFHAAVGTYDVGNPDLRAEVNQGLDGVLRAQRGRVDAQLSAYYNRIENFIAPNIVGDTVTDEGVTVPLNRFSQGTAHLRGVEGRVEGEVARHIVLGVMGDVVRGDFVDAGPLPFMPPARVGGSLRYDTGRLAAGAELRHAFEQGRVSGGDVDIATDAYTLLNLNVSVTLVRSAVAHSLTLRTDNVLDESYREATSRIKSYALNPGRNLTMVYRVLF